MTHHTDTELTPCPFCGGKAYFEIDDDRWQWVECGSCGMQGNRSASLMEDCKPKLAEAWNRRTPAVPTPIDWKLVPQRLTQDMTDAAKCVDGRLSAWKYDDAYKAMLAAAPQPPEAAQVQQDAATHNKNLNGFIDFANQIDFAKPRSASMKRKLILETRDAILDLFKEHLKLRRKIDELAAAPQPPAPVRLPEPVGCTTKPWGVAWNTSNMEAGTKLYTEQQVIDLLAAHGIQKQSSQKD